MKLGRCMLHTAFTACCGILALPTAAAVRTSRTDRFHRAIPHHDSILYQPRSPNVYEAGQIVLLSLFSPRCASEEV